MPSSGSLIALPCTLKSVIHLRLIFRALCELTVKTQFPPLDIKRTKRPLPWGAAPELALLFHYALCLILHQYDVVLITAAVEESRGTGSRRPPALSFLKLSRRFCVSV